MRQVILVTRDDDGQPCTNEAWADQVRYLAGVESVEVHLVAVAPIRWDRGMPNQIGSVGPSTIAINVEDGAQRFPATVAAGPDSNQLMFASKVKSDVDAYVARQAERMGHTEVTRG